MDEVRVNSWVRGSPGEGNGNPLQYSCLENPMDRGAWQANVSVQFSCAVMSDSFWPHELYHTRPPCPSPTPRGYSDSCLSSWRCHPTISSSVVPFSHYQGLFKWVGSLHQVAKVLGFQLQHQSFQWIFRTDFLWDWLVAFLQSKGLSRVFSNTTLQKHQIFRSVQSSHSVMSNSWQHHEPQHARPPCPPPTPRVHPNPCPLSWWCHPTVSSSVVAFSSSPQSFPAAGSFQMSQLFTSVGQSIVVSASTSVLPMNTQDWSPLGWTGWISLQSKGLCLYYFTIYCLKLFPYSKKIYSQNQKDIFRQISLR